VCGEAVNGNDAISQTEQLAPIQPQSIWQCRIQTAPEIVAISPLRGMPALTVQQVSAGLARAAREARFRGVVTKSSGSEVVVAVEIFFAKGTFFDIEG